MKILTKEEEAAHYRETLKGGTIGGVAGLGIGLAGVTLASQRYHFMRQLTLPLKAFLVTSAGTFSGIVSADHWSRAYEQRRNPLDMQYKERQDAKAKAESSGMTFTQKAMEFGRKERYKIVMGSWVASMAAAFALVNRNKYLTGQQKIVQARVYAQFLTLGVLVASAAFEIADSKNEQGRWETVRYIDPNDPEHKRVLEKRVEREGGGDRQEDRAGSDLWKDMVESEERRIKEKDEDESRFKKEVEERRKNKKKTIKQNGGAKKAEKSDEGTGDGSEGKEQEQEQEKEKDTSKK